MPTVRPPCSHTAPPISASRNGTATSSTTRMTFGCGRITATSSSTRLGRRGELGLEHRLQLAFDPPHPLGKLLALARRQQRQRVVDGAVGDLRQLHLDQIRLGGQVQPVDPPVGGVGPAHDPAFLFHAVDHAAGGGLLDLQHFGQLRLGGAGPAMQPVDHQPLRAGQAELAHPAVERGAHQPRDVGDQKPDMALVFG